MATAHDPGAVRQVYMLFYSLVASVLLLSVLLGVFKVCFLHSLVLAVAPYLAPVA